MATNRAFPKNFSIVIGAAANPAVDNRHRHLLPVVASRPPGDLPLSHYVEEARKDSLFVELWAREKDTLFRPYAFAALTFSQVSGLSSNERANLYRDIATAKRAALLDQLSGLTGWKNRIRLLRKTSYQLFDDQAWRTFFVVSEAPATRRALGHLDEISPVLVRQLGLVPEQIRIPAVLGVLNQLDVSEAHWQQLSNALAEAPTQLLPSLIAKARDVTSTGSFWDWFFECVDKPWQPFDLPERFLFSPMLRPLRSIKELEKEGLSMKNCLAGQVANVLQGRQVYFRWLGAQPATVQFVYTSEWHIGRILRQQNKLLPLAELEEIRWWAELLLAGVKDESRASDDGTAPVIDNLCARARHKFTVEERDRLGAALRKIRGQSKGLGSGSNAYCIFVSNEGRHIQFMADASGHEFLCEIQSHHYCTPVELNLTDTAVSLIRDSGFQWPRGINNFSRWFRVSAEADADALAEFSLGILNEIFGHIPNNELTLKVHLP